MARKECPYWYKDCGNCCERILNQRLSQVLHSACLDYAKFNWHGVYPHETWREYFQNIFRKHALGRSFRLTCCSITRLNWSSNFVFILGRISEQEVGCSTFATVALCFEHNEDLLLCAECGCFTIGFDGSTTNWEKHVDILVRCF